MSTLPQFPVPQLQSRRITADEIMRDLALDKNAVYRMLNQNIIPNVRIGRRFIISRAAYEQWLRTCGTGGGSHYPAGVIQ